MVIQRINKQWKILDIDVYDFKYVMLDLKGFQTSKKCETFLVIDTESCMCNLKENKFLRTSIVHQTFGKMEELSSKK